MILVEDLGGERAVLLCLPRGWAEIGTQEEPRAGAANRNTWKQLAAGSSGCYEYHSATTAGLIRAWQNEENRRWMVGTT